MTTLIRDILLRDPAKESIPPFRDRIPRPDHPDGPVRPIWPDGRPLDRPLVPAGTTKAEDSCLQCHTPHIIEAEARPVRWRSWLARK